MAQVGKQAIANEVLPEAAVAKGFAGLTIPPNYLRKLLPAVRAGQTILLYGPPGNGKTSIGTRLASLFQNVIYVPYAIEVNNQIIKMYDGRLHRPFTDESAPALPESNSVRAESFDLRWVACRRPIAIAGGELSLDMLDLRYDPVAKFYDAPLHMKALNGMFLIDDFGRQKVSPTELLNRWIVPLESRIDYLTLSSGVTFMIPFDELVVFSTNLEPADLMDPAFLRRIPYKDRAVRPRRGGVQGHLSGRRQTQRPHLGRRHLRLRAWPAGRRRPRTRLFPAQFPVRPGGADLHLLQPPQGHDPATSPTRRWRTCTSICASDGSVRFSAIARNDGNQRSAARNFRMRALTSSARSICTMWPASRIISTARRVAVLRFELPQRVDPVEAFEVDVAFAADEEERRRVLHPLELPALGPAQIHRAIPVEPAGEAGAAVFRDVEFEFDVAQPGPGQRRRLRQGLQIGRAGRVLPHVQVVIIARQGIEHLGQEFAGMGVQVGIGRGRTVRNR